MKEIIQVLLILLTAAYCANGAKILGIFTAPGRSHYILGSSLMKTLAEKGHEVTVVSAFGEKSPRKNYRDIVVTEIMNMSEEMTKNQEFNLFERESVNPFISVAFIGYMMPKMQQGFWDNKEVQKLIHSGETFDAVIIEQFFNDGQKALAAHFKAPLIVLSTVGANYWVNSLVGNPQPISYVPELVLDYDLPLSFTQRMSNTLMRLWTDIYFYSYYYRNENAKIQKYIPNPPHIYDVLYNSSLVLINSHTSINQPVPYVPNMIDIAGFHIQPPKKLPQDLQEYLDNAKEGVIYFSMGSNLRSADIAIEKREAILKAFSKLKEKVLWKWEEDVLPGQPPNVKLSKWLPQSDILAHPNIKLFITHGGYLSTSETIYHGVPVLAIPILGDQKTNAKVAVRKEYGLMLPYKELTEEKFSKSIDKLLNNPKYQKNVKTISNLFHDRISTPMETAIYWIEYVIRHKGTPHLRVAALDLCWYQYLLLDVMAVLSLGVFSIIFVSYYITKTICRKICSKGKNKKQKTN